MTPLSTSTSHMAPSWPSSLFILPTHLQAVVSSISTPISICTSLPPAQILAWLYNCPFRGTQVISSWTARETTSSADVKLESLSFSPNWFFHRSLGDILNSFHSLTSPTIQLVSALGWVHLILDYCLESIFHSRGLSNNLLVPGTALSTVHACPHWIIWTIS